LALEGSAARRFGPITPKPDVDELGLTDEQLEEYGEQATNWLAELMTLRVLANAAGGGVWAPSVLYEYRIELWGSDGALERVIEPDSDWFIPTRPADE